MTFKPSIWFPIATVLSVLNVIAVAFTSPAYHQTGHALAAVAFGLWAQRLRRASRDASPTTVETTGTNAVSTGSLAALEDEVSRLREELSETQERLDFTERMLTQRSPPDQRRVGPEGSR